MYMSLGIKFDCKDSAFFVFVQALCYFLRQLHKNYMVGIYGW